MPNIQAISSNSFGRLCEMKNPSYDPSKRPSSMYKRNIRTFPTYYRRIRFFQRFAARARSYVKISFIAAFQIFLRGDSSGEESDFSIGDAISIKSDRFNICGPYPYELRFPVGDKSNSRDINRHKGERIINFHCDVVWSSTYNVVRWAFVIIHIHEMPISIVLPASGFDPVCFFVVDTISLFRTRCPFVLLPPVLYIILIDLSVILLKCTVCVCGT